MILGRTSHIIPDHDEAQKESGLDTGRNRPCSAGDQSLQDGSRNGGLKMSGGLVRTTEDFSGFSASRTGLEVKAVVECVGSGGGQRALAITTYGRSRQGACNFRDMAAADGPINAACDGGADVLSDGEADTDNGCFGKVEHCGIANAPTDSGTSCLHGGGTNAPTDSGTSCLHGGGTKAPTDSGTSCLHRGGAKAPTDSGTNGRPDGVMNVAGGGDTSVRFPAFLPDVRAGISVPLYDPADRDIGIRARADGLVRDDEDISVLHGRYLFVQASKGYRFGIDSVILARYAVGTLRRPFAVESGVPTGPVEFLPISMQRDETVPEELGADGVYSADIIPADQVECDILDIGTGCGVIAILIASMLPEVRVTAVEIQPALADRARRNVLLNGLSERITVVGSDVVEFAAQCDRKFDLIVSNPPYFKAGSGRMNPSAEKAVARHELHLNRSTLLEAAMTMMSPYGRTLVIYPA